MLFNSLAYILVLACTLLFFYATPVARRWIVLLTASLFCYGFWRLEYLLLLLACTIINYVAALGIVAAKSEKAKKGHLIFAITSSLGLLFVFKYLNFALGSAFALSSLFGINTSPIVLDLLLPIGISFYTFQALGYVIDVYWEIIEPERHFGSFFLFISFFPQLIAGPIEKAQDLLPQIQDPRASLKESMVGTGLTRIAWGLFKKVVVADNISLYTDVVFANISHHQGLTLYVTAVLFAFQIYCDFSGYTDIAIGSAHLLGIHLSENFLLPYNSTTVQEFWTRWHRTLYTWLYTYVYMPLAYLNSSPAGIARAVVLTFLLSGLWHGASWNFVIFGLIHGVWILLEVLFYGRFARLKVNWVFQITIGRMVTFHVWLASLIWFRCPSFSEAIAFHDRLFGADKFLSFQLLDLGVLARVAVGLFVLLIVEQVLLKKNSFEQLFRKGGMLWMISFLLFCLFMMILFGNSGGGQFIYFQF